mmetsp:Transcript_41837/g.75969  ORF Transcript_41837/g.75969 Transcript_41837/m.75969 type:complete len:788 (+) Transcript_41837:81-2444(+)
METAEGGGSSKRASRIPRLSLIGRSVTSEASSGAPPRSSRRRGTHVDYGDLWTMHALATTDGQPQILASRCSPLLSARASPAREQELSQEAAQGEPLRPSTARVSRRASFKASPEEAASMVEEPSAAMQRSVSDTDLAAFLEEDVPMLPGFTTSGAKLVHGEALFHDVEPEPEASDKPSDVVARTFPEGGLPHGHTTNELGAGGGAASFPARRQAIAAMPGSVGNNLPAKAIEQAVNGPAVSSTQGAEPARGWFSRRGRQNLATGVKEKKNEFVWGVARRLGAEAPDDADAARHWVKARRWWADACFAAHKAHSTDEDPPAPPARAMVELEDGSPCEARGCLEVKLLGFESAQTLACFDGSQATDPIAQFTLGLLGRVSGAVRPPIDMRKADVVRFAVHELVGADLRIHCFDAGSRRFRSGAEERAWIGGAFIPLKAILRKGRQKADLSEWERLRAHEFETEMVVALQPLEVFGAATKLECAELGDSHPRRPEALVKALLSLKLTLYDFGPLRLNVDPLVRGDRALENFSARTVVSLDDPRTMIRAVQALANRGQKVSDPAVLIKVLDDLRETPQTSLCLHLLWTFAVLVGPLWAAPSCGLAALALFVRHYKVVESKHQSANHPVLYVDDLKDTRQGFFSVARLGIVKGVDEYCKLTSNLSQANFAVSLLEKVRYAMSLRSPEVTASLTLFFVWFTFLSTVGLFLMTLTFGQWAVPVMIWAGGSTLLLPNAYLLQLFEFLKWLNHMREQVFGKTMIITGLLATIRRIPDSREATHCELFERYILVPP